MRGVRRLLTYGTVSLVITIIFMLNPGSAISMLHELNDNYIYDDLTGLVWYENLPALNEELYYLGGADTLVWYGMGSVSHLYDDESLI